MKEKSQVVDLKASACVSGQKRTYATAGKIYGHLSTFSHWGHAIHGHFITFERERTGVLYAAIRYRAMALALCAVVLDVFVEVIRALYAERSDGLVSAVQGTLAFTHERNLHRLVSQIANLTKLDEIAEILAFLPVEAGE